MNGYDLIQKIKNAIDSGHMITGTNDGYIVYKDRIGQYLITFRPNGYTIGLCNRSETIPNEDKFTDYTDKKIYEYNRKTDSVTVKRETNPPSIMAVVADAEYNGLL